MAPKNAKTLGIFGISSEEAGRFFLSLRTCPSLIQFLMKLKCERYVFGKVGKVGFNEVKGGYGGGYGGRKNFIDSMFVILSSNIIHFFLNGP